MNIPELTRIAIAVKQTGTAIRDLYTQNVTVETGDGFDFLPWQTHETNVDNAPPVTLDEARALPGIGRGVAYQAGVISQLAPRAYRNVNSTHTTEPILPTPSLLQNPAPGWHPLPTWLHAVAESLKWHGNAFAYRGVEVCDATGYPAQLPLLDAQRMAWRTGYNDFQHTSPAGQLTYLHPGDVAHMALNVRPEHKMGTGILATYQRELKLIRATEQAQFVVMSAGVPTGIIKLTGPNPSADDAQKIKQKFLESQRVRSVAVMAHAEFSPVSWNPTDMAMIPAREFNLRLASDITGTPPYMLGVPAESRVYSNQETEWTNFLRGSIGDLVATIEYGISACMPRGVEVRLPIDQLMRSDAATRWAVYRIARDLDVMTTREIRDAENLGPMPEHDHTDTPDDSETDSETETPTDTENTK